MTVLVCLVLAKLLILLITSNQASSNSIQLFDDEFFLHLHQENDNYVIGQDTIYVEVIIIQDDDNTFDLEIDDVFICTTDEMNDLSQTGCLSPLIDADGLYTIISNGNTNQSDVDYKADIIEYSYTNITNTYRVRFSFLTFNIGRTKMYIHVQLTLQLLSGETVTLSLQTNTGIDLFISSIIGIFEDETSKKIELSLLTQCADYLVLTNPVIENIDISTQVISSSINSTTAAGQCLVASPFVCGQIFTIKISVAAQSSPCKLDIVTISGQYHISFNVKCINNTGSSLCTTYMKDNDSDKVILSFISNYIMSCSTENYPLIFNDSFRFYDDAGFLFEVNKNEDNYFVVNNTIYVEVRVEGYDGLSEDNGNNNIVDSVELYNVLLCISDDDDEAECFDNRQQNGNDYEINIIENSGNDLNSDRVRFSFLAFDTGETIIHIHINVQLIVKIDGFSRIQSFISKTYVVTKNIAVTTNTENILSTSITEENSDNSTTTNVLLTLFFVSVFCCVFIV